MASGSIRLIFSCVLILGLRFQAFGQELKSRMDTISYCAGVSIAVSFQRHGAGDVDLELMTRAIKEVMGKNGQPLLIDKNTSEKIFNSYITEVKSKPGRDFLKENATKEGVVVLPSGLQYKILNRSDATEKPKTNDTVKTHYKGMLIDGTVFDSSLNSSEPGEFPVNKVIKGWAQGLQLMSVGDKFVFYIPHEMGYGERGVPGKIGAYATLIFEVELLEIVKK